jgi:hypothetical protein
MQVPQDDTDNGNRRNGFMEFTHARPKVAQTLHAHWPKHDTDNGNRRNGFVEFTHARPKVARTLHAHWPKHDTNNGSRRNGFVEFTHARPKVARTLHAPLAQKTNKKQMNETPNKDKQTTGNNSRPATAATNSRNFRTVGHPEIPARKNGFNTSFSKENSEQRHRPIIIATRRWQGSTRKEKRQK